MSCFGSESKNGETFYAFHQEEIGELLSKTWQEQQEDHSKDDICYWENICGAERPFIS